MVSYLNKKILIPILGLVALVGVGVLGISAARAGNSTSSFVEGFAERFNLNQDEVQTFFTEKKEDRLQLKMQSKEDSLNQAVTDGVITEEQKQALLQKREEMKNHHEEHREEMQTFFEEQGIDPEALGHFKGVHKGFGHWRSK